MTSSHATPDAHGHGDNHVKTYTRVFIALTIFTVIEYFYAQIFSNAFVVLVLGLMTWAIIKATLVGLYFMHLKYEGKWVYGMLVPAGILACVLVFALIPDVALKAEVDINEPDDDEVAVHLTSPAVKNPAPNPATHEGATH